MMWARSTSWRLMAGSGWSLGGQPVLEGVIDLDDGATGENGGSAPSHLDWFAMELCRGLSPDCPLLTNSVVVLPYRFISNLSHPATTLAQPSVS